MHAVFYVITYSMAAGSIGPTGPLQQGSMCTGLVKPIALKGIPMAL